MKCLRWWSCRRRRDDDGRVHLRTRHVLAALNHGGPVNKYPKHDYSGSTLDAAAKSVSNLSRILSLTSHRLALEQRMSPEISTFPFPKSGFFLIFSIIFMKSVSIPSHQNPCHQTWLPHKNSYDMDYIRESNLYIHLKFSPFFKHQTIFMSVYSLKTRLSIAYQHYRYHHIHHCTCPFILPVFLLLKRLKMSSSETQC